MPQPKADKNDSKRDCHIVFEGQEAGDRRELVPGIFFRWCPAGTFAMGSPETEPDRCNHENQVLVTLTKGYWLGETEVTQKQWQRLMEMTPWNGEPYVKEGDDFAASYITHDDAASYCDRLTTKELHSGHLSNGWEYSLPTEAEWEYACRAGTTTTFSFSSDKSYLSQYGWFNKNTIEVREKYAHQVGLKKANAWGLKDMHGNVCEWCSDWYDVRLAGGQDPLGISSGSHRVIRGGSWGDDGVYCRSADRGFNIPGYRSFSYGFRLAAVPE